MLFENIMHRRADRVERCGTGIANYVFIVTAAEERFVLRCKNDGGYDTAVYLLGKLSACGIPVPAVITSGEYGGFAYLVLSCIPGDDLGNVYGGLDDDEKSGLPRKLSRYREKKSARTRLNTGHFCSTSCSIALILWAKGACDFWIKPSRETLPQSRS